MALMATVIYQYMHHSCMKSRSQIHSMVGFTQDDESNRLNSSYGWSCGYRDGGCHGHGVEAVILMGDAPLLGVLTKYPVSWREGFGNVVRMQSMIASNQFYYTYLFYNSTPKEHF